MIRLEKGDVDYDYDRYGNRIRKYVVVTFEQVGERTYPVWKQVEGFKPQTGLDHIEKVSSIGGLL